MDINQDLISAAQTGNLPRVHNFLDQGANVKFKDDDGMTALMAAAAYNHADIARLLIDRGADVNAQDHNGGNAVLSAVYAGYTEIVQLLLDHGADANARLATLTHDTALMAASLKGFVNTVRVLLAHGANVNAKDDQGWTALILASRQGHGEVVRALLARGADVNATDNEGWTALTQASKEGHIDVVRELLAHGADVHTAGAIGTALKWALSFGHADVVRILVINGADTNATDEWVCSAWPDTAHPCPRQDLFNALAANPKASWPGAGGEQLKMQWVMISSGSFMMGSETADHAQPRHRVMVPAFLIGTTVTTFGQYKQCVTAGVCTPAHVADGTCWLDQNNQGKLTDSFLGDDQPAVCVDWEQAQTFARWAGTRLPTEAEWEYAARSGGKEKLYPWDNAVLNCAQAVFNDGALGLGCGKKSTWPVCAKTAGNTEQGLCDMAGNVAQWVQDTEHSSYIGAPNDGTAWGGESYWHRVTRGGSWLDSISSRALETSSRAKQAHDFCASFVGVRLAQTRP